MITFWAALIATGLAGIGLCVYAEWRRKRAYHRRLYAYSREQVRRTQRPAGSISDCLAADLDAECIGQQCRQLEAKLRAERQYNGNLQASRDGLLDELSAERRRSRYWCGRAKALARWRPLDRGAWTELPDVRASITEN